MSKNDDEEHCFLKQFGSKIVEKIETQHYLQIKTMKRASASARSNPYANKRAVLAF